MAVIGDLVDVDDDVKVVRRLDRTRVLLKTSRRPLKQHIVNVHIHGEMHSVHIVEEGRSNPERGHCRRWCEYGSSEEIQTIDSDKDDECDFTMALRNAEVQPLSNEALPEGGSSYVPGQLPNRREMMLAAEQEASPTMVKQAETPTMTWVERDVTSTKPIQDAAVNSTEQDSTVYEAKEEELAAAAKEEEVEALPSGTVLHATTQLSTEQRIISNHKTTALPSGFLAQRLMKYVRADKRA